MPARVRKQGNKWRVVEPSGRLVRNNSGKPVDGGGHESKTKAERQARAINTRKHGKRPS